MKRIGLTFVELLVVIGIIALLMAVTLTALQSSREQAKAVVCGSNIKQLIFAFYMYEDQNQTLPYSFYNDPAGPSPPGGYSGYIQYDRMGWWWFNFIEGFYEKSNGKRTVARCPSKRLGNAQLQNNILCGNYGVNRSICKSSDDRQSHREEFVGNPLSSGDIPKPSKTLLIVDSGYAILSWWHATDNPPVALGNTIIEDTAYIPGLKINRNRNLLSGQQQDAINGRHINKTVNVGFADGHVIRIKADDLFVEKTGDNHKNKSPLWVPE